MLRIDQVISRHEAARLREELTQAQWVDGKTTAGYQSSQVKHNAQVLEGDPIAKRVGAVLLAALEKNPLFIAAAIPLKVFPPLFNKYEGGQQFGNHIDNAIRQIPRSAHSVRTDLSATLFLTDPEDYDGGELVVENTFSSHRMKLAAGDMLLYPATSLHRVEPVTRGARISSFFWIQSMVRDEHQREILFQLDSAIRQVRSSAANDGALVTLIGVYHNLVRAWADC